MGCFPQTRGYEALDPSSDIRGARHLDLRGSSTRCPRVHIRSIDADALLEEADQSKHAFEFSVVTCRIANRPRNRVSARGNLSLLLHRLQGGGGGGQPTPLGAWLRIRLPEHAISRGRAAARIVDLWSSIPH
jgi:hypothetical protein